MKEFASQKHIGYSDQFLKITIKSCIMIHDTTFNKITFIDWSKVLIMPKHVFYDSSYGTTMSNMIK